MQVVVADDDDLFRRLLERLLARWGYSAAVASDGPEACEMLLAAEHPPLAVIDWNMPGLDGISVCREVRKARPMSELYILMLTSRADKQDLALALDTGANDYVTKPFDARELKARLEVGRRLVTPRPALDPSVSGAVRPAADPSGYSGMLESGLLTPMFDPKTMRFTFGVTSPLLRAWEQDGTMQRVLLDRVQVCPQCQGLPSFRFGCPECGSGRVTNERLIHHYACAHVAPVREFENESGLACPKCHTRDLVVGADFEHLAGPYLCLDCDWSDTDLQQLGHCLRCGFRFPAEQALVKDLVGYHARRRDVLGALAASP